MNKAAIIGLAAGIGILAWAVRPARVVAPAMFVWTDTGPVEIRDIEIPPLPPEPEPAGYPTIPFNRASFTDWNEYPESQIPIPNVVSGPLAKNLLARDPTWGELLVFLKQDQTNKQKYLYGTYDCRHFARQLHDNAAAAGIRSGVAIVWFNRPVVTPTGQYEGHTVNVFNTTDAGLVFIDQSNGQDQVVYFDYMQMVVSWPLEQVRDSLAYEFISNYGIYDQGSMPVAIAVDIYG